LIGMKECAHMRLVVGVRRVLVPGVVVVLGVVAGCGTAVNAGSTVGPGTSVGAVSSASSVRGPAPASAEVTGRVPGGVPLPTADLVESSAQGGEYALVYRGDAGVARAYHDLLVGRGYQVIGDPSAFTATDGGTTVVVAVGAGTVEVTVSS
jgi:hypothetical protein